MSRQLGKLMKLFFQIFNFCLEGHNFKINQRIGSTTIATAAYSIFLSPLSANIRYHTALCIRILRYRLLPVSNYTGISDWYSTIKRDAQRKSCSESLSKASVAKLGRRFSSIAVSRISRSDCCRGGSSSTFFF